jgi:hypothetical protein
MTIFLCFLKNQNELDSTRLEQHRFNKTTIVIKQTKMSDPQMDAETSALQKLRQGFKLFFLKKISFHFLNSQKQYHIELNDLTETMQTLAVQLRENELVIEVSIFRV